MGSSTETKTDQINGEARISGEELSKQKRQSVTSLALQETYPWCQRTSQSSGIFLTYENQALKWC